MVRFWKKRQPQDSAVVMKPRRKRCTCSWHFEKLSVCYKTSCLTVSMLTALTVLITAAIAYAEASGAFNRKGWKAIAIAGMVLSIFQVIINLPYGLFWNNKKEKYAYFGWVGFHIFSSAVSIVLFFLIFYSVPDHSFDLRKMFWSQFKLKVEKSGASILAMMLFTDFVALNILLSLFFVFYPKAARVWERSDREDVNIVMN